MDMSEQLDVTDRPDMQGVQLTLRHCGTGFVCGAVRVPYALIPYLQEQLNVILPTVQPAGPDRRADGA